MLNEQPLYKVLIINVILGIIWHISMLFICVAKNTSTFSPEKRLYRPHKWEKGGKIYSDILKINRWKDMLPQHIGKNGFSKEHLDTVSIEYLDNFILETCRGEWNHTMNCTFAFVLFLLNNALIALILSLLLILGNLPFIIIQRYNRFRLQKLRTILLKRNTQRRTAKEPAASQNIGS